MTELKPCPFCGGEAEFYPAACIEQGWYIATVQCVSCAAQVCSKPGLDRAEQEANESAVKSWNTRAERTCHMLFVKLYDEEDVEGIECDECGYTQAHDWSETLPAFCLGCGAKVVEV